MTDTIAAGQREAVARIVDPIAWRVYEQQLEYAGEKPSDPLADPQRYEAWHYRTGLAGQAVASSLAKADAILAIQSPDAVVDERERLREEIVNTPETADFMAGVPLEAAHQRSRWGVDHDAGKSPFDWFWLIGYLAQKAADASVRGDAEKAMHHTISTAAALANWHAALSGKDLSMRPGIGPENGGDKPGSAYSLASAIRDGVRS
jgi:hypothetical protein